MTSASWSHFKGFYFLKFREAAKKNCFVPFPVGHADNTIIFFLHFFLPGVTQKTKLQGRQEHSNHTQQEP